MNLTSILGVLTYTDALSRMVKEKPETWFLPIGYQIIRQEHSGCVNIMFYTSSMRNPAGATGDLFNCIVKAHEHYQEGLFIQKLNAQAKR